MWATSINCHGKPIPDWGVIKLSYGSRTRVGPADEWCANFAARSAQGAARAAAMCAVGARPELVEGIEFLVDPLEGGGKDLLAPQRLIGSPRRAARRAQAKWRLKQSLRLLTNPQIHSDLAPTVASTVVTVTIDKIVDMATAPDTDASALP